MTTREKSKGELLISLYSKDSQTRRESVEKLNEHMDERVLFRLAEHLDDENKGVRDAICQILFEHCEECPSITEPILRYIFVGSIETKNLASEIIVKIGQPSIDYLQYALTCDDRDVRKFIADTLGFIGHPDAIKYLTTVFDDEDPNVGFSSIEAVGSIGSEQGLIALQDVCKRNPDLRAMAIEAIGKIGDEKSLPFIESYLNDEDPMVGYSCLDAIGNIPSIKSYELLCKVFDTLDEMGQESVVESLFKLLKTTEINEIDAKFFDGILSQFENEHDYNERINALMNLAKVKHRNTIKTLLRIANQSEDLQEQVYLCLNKKTYSDESELTSLISSVSGTSLEILLSVIREHEMRSAIEPLISIFDSATEETQLLILHVLGGLGVHDQSSELLSRMLTYESEMHVSAAVKALGELECQDKFEELLNILNTTESEEIAFAVLESFVSMGGENSIQFFKEMFASDDIEDKSMALQALSALDEEVTILSINELIDSGNSESILLAIEVIKENELDEFSNSLIEIYDESDSDIKKEIIAFTLGRHKEHVSDEFILNALMDKDKWVQIHTLETLEDSKESLLHILEKLDITKLDPFAVRSLFDHLQKIVSDSKVRVFLIENINKVDEEIQNMLIESTDTEFQQRLRKKLSLENNG